VIRKELLTGVLLGTAVAALFYPFVMIGWGDADVALAVSLSLLCSCSIATAVAMVLPITLRRLGYDPAFGSGPLATVIQDLLSILIYFAIGVPLAA
jgi:magnesium transporter